MNTVIIDKSQCGILLFTSQGCPQNHSWTIGHTLSTDFESGQIHAKDGKLHRWCRGESLCGESGHVRNSHTSIGVARKGMGGTCLGKQKLQVRAELELKKEGFPGGLAVKNLPANVRDADLIPVLGRSPESPGKSHGQRSLEGCMGS